MAPNGSENESYPFPRESFLNIRRKRVDFKRPDKLRRYGGPRHGGTQARHQYGLFDGRSSGSAIRDGSKYASCLDGNAVDSPPVAAFSGPLPHALKERVTNFTTKHLRYRSVAGCDICDDSMRLGSGTRFRLTTQEPMEVKVGG